MEIVGQQSNHKDYIQCGVCDNTVCMNDDDCYECNQCGTKHQNISPNIEQTLFFSLTALILYIPANLLPFMIFELHGNRTEATIWSGIVTLAKDGSYFLAAIVFIASMLVPFIKLVTLFYLSLSPNTDKNRKFKTKIFKFMEAIGPWSMLDIFLVAVFVAIVKLDSMGDTSAGLGALMFLFVVIFTMLASKNFNLKAIWQKQ